jgi:hypothetical protein
MVVQVIDAETARATQVDTVKKNSLVDWAVPRDAMPVDLVPHDTAFPPPTMSKTLSPKGHNPLLSRPPAISRKNMF